ncbi:hydroxymethylbilane synthase [Novipirellula artificiosorum]|uniref:Porphobilinogen deaminase n=1 Tax=Novipirellula artificiosorum TaxID=2528016 RepID=A0A5C6DDC2_9BACT|nr:hydroxymethylbilane synthase [Novipirellula artificiosorum]TWU33767.1 Porphobilinogen deaminase [Novipirellula artificiosorum]
MSTQPPTPPSSEPCSSPSRSVRIATRYSALAMWQAEHVANLLSNAGVATEIVPLISSGDTDMRPIDATRQVGVFTKRIQQALIDNEADIAVHSLKDLPTEVDSRLTLIAVPPREVVNDCLVSPARWTLDSLPAGACIGTGSRRRAAQLKNRRPDLNIQPIRGNLQTRLEKLQTGDFDAIMLASAGLMRLKMDSVPRVELSLVEMMPAPGQGALAIEVRSDATEIQAATQCLNDLATRAAVTAERSLLANLNGGCLAPIAGYAQILEGHLRLDALVLSVDGSKRLEDSRSIRFDENHWQTCAERIAAEATENLASRGARELIAEVRL